MDRLGRYFLDRPSWLIVLVTVALVALPLAVWLDLRALSDETLRRQATSLNGIVSSVRSYYARNVVQRVVTSDVETQALHNYLEVEGAIPIPATLSLELGEAIGEAEGDVRYRFVSDYSFADRPPHVLSPFERSALEQFRSNPDGEPFLVHSTGNIRNREITLATPVVMAGACVECHNAHPKSPKQDWKVGDVRAVQTVTVRQPVALNLWSFKWLLLYFAVAGSIGLLFAMVQFRLAGRFSRMNAELAANNAFLADISLKISKYLSPQVYKSIFSGEKDASISTERKKLTVFFSDIKDFTATTEQMQPEELTALLNQYFSEMAKIAEAHGATIDKFIGDAIVAFFGDPETRGAREDARACVKMALAMQRRLAELEADWSRQGLEHPFKARMGINTGYCNVGNFGSEERMDYTIIGAEANLAARLENIAEPGGIVMSYETYAHVRDIVEATPGEPVQMKGIARSIVPYHIKSVTPDPVAAPVAAVEEGDTLTLDLKALDEATRDILRCAVHEALRKALDGKTAG
ncbi:adenylate/guanylate cyclase domain-containing protein [Phaeobacter sp. QD34_3]|uniref:adenylate/guanylate cyclase domain-containing protein n=1 Tax=unclassified Phaeobacter TaxID=2621772 RepID=UPI00237F1775|nr:MULTISPECIES: adenylate/guanylate cyclase domain-containing protein [unclassified Phaeobacter]MDE4133035.1 adenylate/guanylate cyclase domain-containing protein [Phaeobacter sp. QD34_3]MDE4136563.1 adenylate/guanylate cyclase domain-containing protein [Phaeobacter sp. QD34_24]